MSGNIRLSLAAVLVMLAALTGCGDDSHVTGSPVRVAEVTDTTGISDPFNATVWKGIQDASRDLGLQASYRESHQESEYDPNIRYFTEQNYDLIFTVGYRIADATKAAAVANPSRKFAIIDTTLEPPLPNVLGVTFNTDEATFLAGYLAAGMSKTGRVGVFGGMPLPPVIMFMVGFEQGVLHYNRVKNANVTVIGWKTEPGTAACGTGRFTGNFTSTDDGRTFAEQLMAEGADVILPVAGPVGLGAAAAISEQGNMMIGVDSDQFYASPDYRGIFLTTILKNSDRVASDIIRSVVNNTFKGGTYVGTLANGGMGLAPYHDFDAAVPPALKAEIERLKQEINAGTIATGWSDCQK